MMKRVIAMFLAGVMLITSVQVPVWADEVITNLEEDEVIEEENADSIDEVIDAAIEITDEDDIIEVDDSTEEPLLGANADQSKINNPRSSNGVVTWDCVYFGNYWQNDTNGDGTADKNDAKEKIKWRVLSVDGNDAFLIADQSLDCQKYNASFTDVTWKTCTLRSWLNGYGSSSNVEGSDYSDSDKNFMDTAFTSSEQGAIIQTTLVNADNPYDGTEGGDDTQDKIFLLSYDDAVNNAYGFASDYSEEDEARWAKNTAYAKAAGAYTNDGNGWWWLRSPGNLSTFAMTIRLYGLVGRFGEYVSDNRHGVRPALHLNLSSSLWSYAGTVSSKGDIVEPPTEYIINGKGYATATFLLKDNGDNILKNTRIKYYFVNSAGGTECANSEATSDKDGYVTIRTKDYDNTSSITANPQKYKLTTYLVYAPDGNNILSNTKTVIDVRVNPPSFTEKWSLASDANLKATVGIGADAAAGTAELKSSLAELEGTAGVGNTISVANKYSEGKRTLELAQTYSPNIGVNSELGMTYEADFFDGVATLGGSIAKISGGMKGGIKRESGLKISDYSPSNASQLFQIGGFMLGTSAVAQGNAFTASLFKLLNNATGHSLNNVTSEYATINVKGGCEVGTVSTKIGSYGIGSGSVINLEGDTNYSLGRKKDYDSSSSGSPIYSMKKDNCEARKILSYDCNPYGVNGAVFDNDKYINSYSLESSDDKFKIESYKAHGTADSGLTDFRINDCMEFTGESRNKLLNKVDTYKTLSEGKAKISLDGKFKEDMEKWNNSDIRANYSEKYERTSKISTGKIGLKVGGGAGAYVDVGGDIKITGIYSKAYDLSKGYYEGGKVYLTSVTDVGDRSDVYKISNPGKAYELGEVGAIELINEGFDAIVDDVINLTVKAAGAIANGVKNLFCTVVSTGGKTLNRVVSIISIDRFGMGRTSYSKAELASMINTDTYPSFEIMTYERSSGTSEESLLGAAGDKLKGTAVTIGDAYLVSMYEEDETTEVESFADTPIDITLEYTDEMIESAGLESDEEELIEIFKYVEEDCGYVSVGGEVDTLDNSVKVEGITEPGQFILAVNKDDNAEMNPEDEGKWIDKLTKISDTEYVLNLATKEKLTIPELAKAKSDGKNYKIKYDKVGKKSDSQYAAMTSKGLITAKKAGVSHITLNKNGVEYKITVNVFNPQFKYENPKKKYFTVNTGSTVTPAYEDCKLKPAFTLDKNAIKKGLATINPETGEVTPLKKGTVKVTATVGGEEKPGYARKVTTTVRIYDPVIYTGKKSEVKVNKVLKASVKNGVKGTNDWKSSDEAIATVDKNGRIRGIAPGVVTISCTNNGKPISKEITVIENPRLK